MTFAEWVACYKKKTGQEFTPRDDEAILIDLEKGFCSYSIDPNEKILIVGGVCGDGIYWDNLLRNIAKSHSCKQIIFYTDRNPKAWERKLGYKLHSYVMVKEVE